MPSRDDHCAAGASVGCIAACLKVPANTLMETLLVIAGGGLGGAIGGILPDRLEPAVHPKHRSIAHGASSAWVVAKIGGQGYLAAIDGLIGAAEVAASTRRGEVSWGRIWRLFLAAFLVGLPAGYASHLVLDALTPAGLPM